MSKMKQQTCFFLKRWKITHDDVFMYVRSTNGFPFFPNSDTRKENLWKSQQQYTLTLRLTLIHLIYPCIADVKFGVLARVKFYYIIFVSSK